MRGTAIVRLLSVMTAMLACISVQVSAQDGLQPMQHKSTHDWAVVNEFGDSKCFVDRNSIEQRGEITRALVMYSAVPPGTDKRNNKKVAAMLNVEEYDLRAGVFRIQQIVFQYIDGTESEPLSTDLKWRPATGGNQRTLRFLQDAKSESISVGSVALDTAYAGFSHGKVTDNEKAHPGYGYTVAYHGGDRGEATIYVYSKGQRDIPDGPSSETVMAEFNQATREILSFGQSAGRTIELVSRYGTGSPERGKEFLCAEFILSDDSGSRRTFVYLTGAAGNFVKIRVTLRTNDATDPTARNFADAVANRLSRK